MNQKGVKTCLFLALLSSIISSLNHEKSFLLQDGASTVWAIAIYKESILLTAVNDVIQKDIETGAIQRTFRGHTSAINSFVTTSDSRIITCGLDDMIMVWNLKSGSLVKKIWLGSSDTLVKSIDIKNDQVVSGGNDGKLRSIDLVTGRVTTIASSTAFINKVLVDDEFIYVARISVSNGLEKLRLLTSASVLRFQGHASSVNSLYLDDNGLFSVSFDRTIILWNPRTGEKIRTFQVPYDAVQTIIVIDNEVYVAGNDRVIISWNINTGSLIKFIATNSHSNVIMCFAAKDQVYFTGSQDTTVVQWRTNSTSPQKKYSSRPLIIRQIGIWRNFVISASEDTEIRMWDTSLNSVAPYAVFYGHSRPVNCIQVVGDTFFSGSIDKTIRHWFLQEQNLIKILNGHTNTVNVLATNDIYLFSGGQDLVAKQWNISSGEFIKTFPGHLGPIMGLQATTDTLYTGCVDLNVRIFDIASTQLGQQFSAYQAILTLILLENSVLVGHSSETNNCVCLASTFSRVYSGHTNGLIHSRSPGSLEILETFQGHQDSVYHISFDEALTLYSSSFDGSIKKWNRLTRKVAFSFEIRNGSVTALAAIGNIISIGSKSGVVNSFFIDTAMQSKSVTHHSKEVTSIIAINGTLVSSGSDGFLVSRQMEQGNNIRTLFSAAPSSLKSIVHFNNHLLAIRDDSDILFLKLSDSANLERNLFSSFPLLCIANYERYIIAGSKSGQLLAWDLERETLTYNLKGHNAQINSLVVDKRLLYSASDDKAIIQWSLETFIVMKVLQRYSTRELGHLGPVNSLTVCNNVLFSGGSDLTIRRWNTMSGNHEDVYFGPSKSVTSVLCHNSSLFAGSEDFSVLMYKPEFEDSYFTSFAVVSSRASGTRKGKTVQIAKNSDRTSQQRIEWTLIVFPILGLVILIISAVFFRRKNRTQAHKDSDINSTGVDTDVMITDLQTVVNTVMGISKHAAYLIETSALASTKKIAAGGGGELYLASVMDPTLRSKIGKTVIKKVVFVNSPAGKDAFYQEVGIMVMLLPFPNFCRILGYTEKPFSIILEFYPDGSLNEWLRSRKCARTISVKVLREISQGLNVMHSHYLAHCDLKPQNILVTVSNGIPTCFITDFGITQVLSESIIAAKSFQIINLRGLSVYYASPEAFKSFRTKNYSKANFKMFDVYSFGCLAYEVQASKSPWH